jgi:serine/threonine-protein kinase RIO1
MHLTTDLICFRLPFPFAPSLYQGELVIIDVSQAVDLDHPKALDFLREDCAHINDFFRRRGQSPN